NRCSPYLSERLRAHRDLHSFPTRRSSDLRLAEWVADYGLAERGRRLRLSAQSAWIGKRLDQLDLRATAGINIIAIERRRRFSLTIVEPTASTVLEAGDVLFLDVRGPAVDIDALCAQHGLERLPLT